MKLKGLNSLLHIIFRLLKLSDKKAYLSQRVANFEKQIIEHENHPFKIVDIREKGFIVKTYGLFGYVSFYHMPWKYKSVDSWRTVFPYIKGKVLFGKVYKFEKKPLLIILDGEIQQFKKPELFENTKYKGVIINKTNFGVFVDIGYHYNWRFGSLSGLLHRLNFENEKLFEKSNTGELIELEFWGYAENKQLIFGQRPELKEWFTGEIEKQIGAVLPVNVVKDNGETRYLVENKYNASLPVTKTQYPNNLTQIKRAVRKLIDGDIIHCEIIKVNRTKRSFQILWSSVPEIEGIISRDIIIESPSTANTGFKLLKNRIKIGVKENPELVGKIVKVEIIKKEDNFGRLRTKYLIENKYKGELHISNDSYIISNKEKKQIEKDLQEGEVLYCEVLSVENNLVSVKWNLKEEELIRFLRQ